MATMKEASAANWFVLWLLYAMRKKLLNRIIFLTHSLTYKLILIFRNNLMSITKDQIIEAVAAMSVMDV